MGTNYYIWLDAADGQGDPEKLHIGKSSAGWVFGLRVYPELGIISLYDWMKIMLDRSTVIRDEYGRHISTHEMLETIVCRSRDFPVEWNVSDWSINQAEPGPNNLIRGREFGEPGRGRTHGEGTWDYCHYEFF
jgi:hypothetical protein